MYKLVLCLMVCLFLGTNAEVGCPCTSPSDCDDGECCENPNYDNTDYGPILSKRRVTITAVPCPNYDNTDNGPILSKRRVATSGGTCQLMKSEGECCTPYDRGYCGCGPNLECSLSYVTNIGKRLMAPDQQQGVFTCKQSSFNY